MTPNKAFQTEHLLAASSTLVIGLDGGYVKSYHRRPERNFEVIVGKVIDPDDSSTRIGFVHEFRPLGAAETRQLLERQWTPPGVRLPARSMDPETIAAIIRITNGNFRLLNRMLTQIERILEINVLDEVTKAVVEAARESLVIGEA